MKKVVQGLILSSLLVVGSSQAYWGQSKVDASWNWTKNHKKIVIPAAATAAAAAVLTPLVIWDLKRTDKNGNSTSLIKKFVKEQVPALWGSLKKHPIATGTAVAVTVISGLGGYDLFLRGDKSLIKEVCRKLFSVKKIV